MEIHARAFIVLCVLLTAVAAKAETMPGPFAARVVRVVDGDTLIVQVGLWFGQSVIEHVRISGIDSPELRGRCEAEREAARIAQRFLSELVDRKYIQLWQVRREKYGRVLATVTADGIDVSKRMLEAGHARAYFGARRNGWC